MSYETIAAGAYAHWMPYGGTTSTPNDVSGNGRNLAWTGTAAYTTTPSGLAFNLDGASHLEATLPATETAWSMFARVTVPSAQAEYTSVACSRITANLNNSWQLDADAVGGWRLFSGNPAQAIGASAATNQISLAISSDGTTVKAYYEGLPVYSVVSSGLQLQSVFRLGANRGNNVFITGQIADVILLNRVATDAEVLEYHDGPAVTAVNQVYLPKTTTPALRDSLALQSSLGYPVWNK